MMVYPIGKPERADFAFYPSQTVQTLIFDNLVLTGSQSRVRWRESGGEWNDITLTVEPNLPVAGQSRIVINWPDATLEGTSRVLQLEYAHQILFAGQTEWRGILSGYVWMDETPVQGNRANWAQTNITIGDDGVIVLTGLNVGLGLTAAELAAGTTAAAAEIIRVANEIERVKNTSKSSIRQPALSISRVLDAGPEEPSAIVTNGATCVRDASSGFYAGDNGWLITVPSSGSSVVEFDMIANPRVFGKGQVLQIAADTVSGSGAITFINYQVWQTALNDQIWARAVFGAPTGVNRVRANLGVVTSNWGTAHKLRLTFSTTGACQIRVRRIAAEVADFPKIVMITDGAYKNLFTSGFYASIKQRQVPWIFALLPGRLGGDVGNVNEIPTLLELTPYFNENRNEVTAHSWGPGTTNALMTAAEIIEEAKKLFTWFTANRLPRPLIRGAWLQNTAPQHAQTQGYWAAYASPVANSVLECWPPIDPWNIGRITLTGRTLATYRSYFDDVGRTNGTLIVYCHGVDVTNAGGIHMTTTEVTNFLTALDEGIANYGFKGVNFTELVERMGTEVQITPNGEDVLLEVNAAGAIVPRTLRN
jgi:hypothetical protein